MPDMRGTELRPLRHLYRNLLSRWIWVVHMQVVHDNSSGPGSNLGHECERLFLGPQTWPGP
jgi:hypothetical protein